MQTDEYEFDRDSCPHSFWKVDRHMDCWVCEGCGIRSQDPTIKGNPLKESKHAE